MRVRVQKSPEGAAGDGRAARWGLAVYRVGGLVLAALVVVGCLLGMPLLGTIGAHKALVRSLARPPPAPATPRALRVHVGMTVECSRVCVGCRGGTTRARPVC